ncbi:hypothetical protein GC207_09980 [bacterium]|nr:hypothetical protein [bacterium]
MKEVKELTGSMRGVETDTELVFPNIQTCVAVVAVVGPTLVGAHITLADRGRLSAVAELIKKQGPVADLYVVGPILGPYNVSSFANFGGRPHLCATPPGPPWIDVRAKLIPGGVQFERRNTGTTAWSAIPDDQFVS